MFEGQAIGHMMLVVDLMLLMSLLEDSIIVVDNMAIRVNLEYVVKKLELHTKVAVVVVAVENTKVKAAIQVQY
jgi:hypothetical protein